MDDLAAYLRLSETIPGWTCNEKPMSWQGLLIRWKAMP